VRSLPANQFLQKAEALVNDIILSNPTNASEIIRELKDFYELSIRDHYKKPLQVECTLDQDLEDVHHTLPSTRTAYLLATNIKLNDERPGSVDQSMGSLHHNSFDTEDGV